MIAKLAEIANKQERTILGMMSGTSLDGLDLALCVIRGAGKDTSLEVLQFKTISYAPSFVKEVKAIFSKPRIDLAKLCAMNAIIGSTHAAMVLDTLEDWNTPRKEVDLIASHGQTVYHAPQSLTGNYHVPNSTLQIGDGDHVAVKTGIITLSDFRQKHVAAGGEGAPLAVYGDRLLFSHKEEDRFLLNIGGISNFTYLPAAKYDTDNLLSTDTGPGNTLMNHYMQQHFNQAFDDDGQFASKGTVHPKLLEALFDHSFFALPTPKTTGPELFNLAYLTAAQKNSSTQKLAHEDVMATLAAFTVNSIALSIESIQTNDTIKKILVSGGGFHNSNLMYHLQKRLPSYIVNPLDELGVTSDAKEAILFALLANETIAGNPQGMMGGIGAPTVSLGKISLPY
ncbi:anhydro-N-acetylmuramic acid kinase [Olivibacter sp. SDN3]|uniref:anhydro-N-acetylmuramic acid kinase n=1 Tax=Olivibacter sp. SDN3 TaxID=2764720 RepID=UPI001651A44C|nr:anhydro-N-acetylmuramic acid kinase [Olivibacter sp. SDN3]QNL51307.1 anhydro-N-acetylmuramic acid kinase [Olivibacter sp. SDN3]